MSPPPQGRAEGASVAAATTRYALRKHEWGSFPDPVDGFGTYRAVSKMTASLIETPGYAVKMEQMQLAREARSVYQ